MDEACLAAACNEVRTIRKNSGLNHGVLLCETPSLPLAVAAIRCGLRDVVIQFIDAHQLLKLLKSANPDLKITRRQLDETAAFLRMFSGFSGAQSPVADLAQREKELARRTEQMMSTESRLASERESLEARERDLRERTRRVDRQLAMLQTDADVSAGSGSNTSSLNLEFKAKALQLEQRAAELDLREKLLGEMQELLASQASAASPARGNR